MFVIRTIKNGQVKIYGKIFRPNKEIGGIGIPYDGRLDGMRYAFALYKDSRGFKDFTYLWGTEKQYRSGTDGDLVDWGKTPDCIDGVFHWVWWSAI